MVGRSLPDAGVAGFGNLPLGSAPLQARIFGTQQLGDAGITSIGGITALDASLADAYNAVGYWSILAARGYTLDNRYNYRRDGLPINAETAIAIENKERLEVLMGTSGIQAGSSAPGGLVNLVVKRPTGSVRSASVAVRQGGSMLGSVDLGERFGVDGRFGVRLNAVYERLDPQERNTRGRRSLLALALDAQLSSDSLLQAEIEASHQMQPSVAAYSLHGDSVPDVRRIDIRRNLNDQPWREPVVMDGTTASLRWQQRLTRDWTLTVHAMQQRLRSDDRVAFPYGVYDPLTYDCPQWCDSFAPDGSFTYWQYVSDNERRDSNALAFTLAGKAQTAGIAHTLEAGLLRSRFEARFQDQVFDIAGPGNVDGSLTTLPSPGGTDANTHRDESSTEVFVRDVMRVAPRWQVWAGLRHTVLERRSERTSAAADGLRPTRYQQRATLPWLALAYDLGPQTVAYASAGEGLESEVAPNRARYTNSGQALPALKSRQTEFGLKHNGPEIDAALTLFNISRPAFRDIPTCISAKESCTRRVDGSARHRGIELATGLRQAPWAWQASVLWLDAERRGSIDAGLNGRRPINVPRATFRLSAEHELQSLPGFALQAVWHATGDRLAKVLGDGSEVKIPGWASLDIGARWRQTVAGTTMIWRVGLDNAADRRVWKESPLQFGHVYLYPLQARTWRCSLQVSL